jgi:hypothetical protein
MSVYLAQCNLLVLHQDQTSESTPPATVPRLLPIWAEISSACHSRQLLGMIYIKSLAGMAVCWRIIRHIRLSVCQI